MAVKLPDPSFSEWQHLVKTAAESRINPNQSHKYIYFDKSTQQYIVSEKTNNKSYVKLSIPLITKISNLKLRQLKNDLKDAPKKKPLRSYVDLTKQISESTEHLIQHRQLKYETSLPIRFVVTVLKVIIGLTTIPNFVYAASKTPKLMNSLLSERRLMEQELSQPLEDEFKKSKYGLSDTQFKFYMSEVKRLNLDSIDRYIAIGNAIDNLPALAKEIEKTRLEGFNFSILSKFENPTPEGNIKTFEEDNGIVFLRKDSAQGIDDIYFIEKATQSNPSRSSKTNYYRRQIIQELVTGKTNTFKYPEAYKDPRIEPVIDKKDPDGEKWKLALQAICSQTTLSETYGNLLAEFQSTNLWTNSKTDESQLLIPKPIRKPAIELEIEREDGKISAVHFKIVERFEFFVDDGRGEGGVKVEGKELSIDAEYTLKLENGKPVITQDEPPTFEIINQ